MNDLGGGRDGTGADTGPAQEVVDEITAAGGEAAANTDDISSWDGAASLVQQAIDTFGGLDVLVNNAGILRDRMLFSMTEEEWDARHPGPPQGHVRAEPPRRGLLAGTVEGRRGRSTRDW